MFLSVAFPLTRPGTTPRFWKCFKNYISHSPPIQLQRRRGGHNMIHSRSGGELTVAVTEKPPLPPERAMSPGTVRRFTKSPPPANRCLSPERLAVAPRQTSPPPEAEIAKILSFEMPPKRNSVVNFDADDSQIFRPIDPSPITGYRDETRPMSPTPRPFSPIPEWFDDDLLLDSSSSPPPSCPSSPNPQLSSPTPNISSPTPHVSSPTPHTSSSMPHPPSHAHPSNQANHVPSLSHNPTSPSQSRCVSQPSNLVVRISPRDRKRPVSAPGLPFNVRPLPGSSCRPISPPTRGSRPRSAAGDSSRFVKYRSFQDDRHEEFLRRKKERRPSTQALVEPKWQVISLLLIDD